MICGVISTLMVEWHEQRRLFIWHSHTNLTGSISSWFLFRLYSFFRIFVVYFYNDLGLTLYTHSRVRDAGNFLLVLLSQENIHERQHKYVVILAYVAAAPYTYHKTIKIQSSSPCVLYDVDCLRTTLCLIKYRIGFFRPISQLVKSSVSWPL